jgi:hypothetical protein
LQGGNPLSFRSLEPTGSSDLVGGGPVITGWPGGADADHPSKIIDKDWNRLTGSSEAR